MMKKSLLALAVAALSANAFAIDLDETSSKPSTFANEIVVGTTGTVIGANKLSVKSKAGFAVTNGFVRVELDNGAVFKGTPKIVAADVSTGTGTGTVTAAAGKIVSGGDGQSFVIFDGMDLDTADTFEVTTAVDTTSDTVVDTGIKVLNKNAVGVTVGVYDTAANAATKTTPLYTNAGTLLNFKQALSVKAEQGNIGNIAIGVDGSNFTTFTNTPNTESNILDLTVTADTSYLAADGSPVSVAKIINGYTWKLDGDFGAAAKTGAVTAATGGAFTLADDKLSASLSTTTTNTTITGAVTYTVDGSTIIPESLFSATFTPEAVSGYAVSAKTFSDVANLQRDGSFDTANLALKPDGAYRNYVRISNTSSVAGKFFLEVTNDDGQAVTFSLGDVEGQSASLNAGASTTQMSIEQIYAAAQAKGLQLSGQGKLRLKASGQVSDGGVSLQTYTVSKDGNSFATF